jgi:hypothetical protein
LQKVGAARRAARYRATRRVAPTIGFARLASGAFYKAIVLVTFYEIIKIGTPIFRVSKSQPSFKLANLPAPNKEVKA